MSGKYPSASARHVLLNTGKCKRFRDQLHNFENAAFGSDFECDTATVEHWHNSGSFFQAAVVSGSEARPEIHAVTSVLITTSFWQDRLLKGEIQDFELQPWPVDSSQTEPVLYLASVISDTPRYLAVIYDSLTVEVGNFLACANRSARSGFAIAAGSAGFKHLFKSGFQPMRHAFYQQKYPLMSINEATARTRFWRAVMSSSPDLEGISSIAKSCVFTETSMEYDVEHRAA
jgi:hypothetical protein